MPFHPALTSWFQSRLGDPTPAQAQAWPAIEAGRHVLIAAPTGSGKTLAAFYAAIDDLVRRGLDGTLENKTYVVYVSPLKALSNDIRRNLEVPLRGIEDELKKSGLSPAQIRAAVRTGDTESSERQKMSKNPPHILVTTPESLYLLLTSDGGRKMLESARTLIVDEIHALVADKRGSHLALSIERLEALVSEPLQRIGLSATQKPVGLVARFLVGAKNLLPDGTADCTIVDSGHRRKLDLKIEVPDSPLTAVMSNEVWSEIHAKLVALVESHRTTLIFVNTRRLAERLSRALAERIGEEHVSSHHGSMSKEHRHRAEQNLKAGNLKVLVATASMELGIDIGSVDLVVQIASPKRIASFLQRVGRSGHQVGGTSKGILIPLSREELVEAAALLDSVRRGELDRILVPEAPLDVLSQQIVAETASREWNVDALYALFKNAYPYRGLKKERFVEIVRMLADGFTTRRGRRGTYVHYDALNGVVRGRRGARLAALTNGGAIPDMFDYEVVLQPEGITVGTLNEDFALESLAGDIFTLGTHSWQMIRIEGLKVLVQDAAGKPPTVPFWLGESAARSEELSESVSRLRETIGRMLDVEPLSEPGREPAPLSLASHPAVQWLVREAGVAEPAAEQAVLYLWMGKTGLGAVPTRERLVLERFFDEAGDTHLVIHTPYGSRLNRAWGLALRKKFCQSFNFELQAAADENSIILSLSSSHSFPLEDVFRYLPRRTARETLVQAMLDAPLFEIRWRWNATRSLAILRNRNGKRVPPPLQRMQAEDLIAQVFPDQIACAENIQGPRQIPDHPLVDQVVHDCLHEAMDIDGLEALLERIEKKEIETVAKELREPSAFAQEIINARPYAFLDDTEFAERRVNAIKNRQWLDPAEARDLGALSAEAVERVREEAWPDPQNPDELHDALMIHGFLTEAEGEASGWGEWFAELVAARRAARLRVSSAVLLWIAAERAPYFEALYPDAKPHPAIKLPEELIRPCSAEEALRETTRGRFEALGPVTLERLARDAGLALSQITQAAIALETEGFVFRGSFTPPVAVPGTVIHSPEEWCERRLLRRIHKYTIDALRESIKPVSVQDFTRFLIDRHRAGAADKENEHERTGPETLRAVLEDLEGFEAPAAAWEADLIPARMSHYDPAWLDALCLSGEVAWGRFHAPKNTESGKSGPVKSTPICIVPRANRQLWQALAQRPDEEKTLSGAAQKVADYLKSHGASFFNDIVSGTGLLKSQAEDGIAGLVAAGLAVSDSYAGLRALLTPSANKPSENGGAFARRRRARQALFGIEHASRWSLVRASESETDPADKWDYDALEETAYVYLRRWGVFFRTLAEREPFCPPWRVLVRVLRRLELRGELRGGRFVSQATGEQFALPETVDALRRVAKRSPDGRIVSLSAADPLNLVGTLLPGKRIARLASNRVALRDGVPVAALEGKEVKFLKDLPEEEQWDVRNALLRRGFPPKLRAYLGRNYA